MGWGERGAAARPRDFALETGATLMCLFLITRSFKSKPGVISMVPSGAGTGTGSGMVSIDNEYFPFEEVVPPPAPQHFVSARFGFLPRVN